MARGNDYRNPYAAPATAGNGRGSSDRYASIASWALTGGSICLIVSWITFLLCVLFGELFHRSEGGKDLYGLLSYMGLWTALVGPAMAGAALWRGPSVVRFTAISLLVFQAPLFFRVASWLIKRALVI